MKATWNLKTPNCHHHFQWKKSSTHHNRVFSNPCFIEPLGIIYFCRCMHNYASETKLLKCPWCLVNNKYIKLLVTYCLSKRLHFNLNTQLLKWDLLGSSKCKVSNWYKDTPFFKRRCRFLLLFFCLNYNHWLASNVQCGYWWSISIKTIFSGACPWPNFKTIWTSRHK